MQSRRQVTTSQTTVSVKGTDPDKKAIFRAYQIIWYVLGVIETFLVFRFLFKIFGANPLTPFVRFLYGFSEGFVAPFRGIFPVGVVEGSVFEWAALVAMAVYVVLAYGIIYLFQLVKPVDPQDVEEVIDNP